MNKIFKNRKRMIFATFMAVLLVAVVSTCAVYTDRISSQMFLTVGRWKGEPIIQQWTEDATTDFHAYKDKVTSITFLDHFDTNSDTYKKKTSDVWDVSHARDESVRAYMVGTDVYICSDVDRKTDIIANPLSSYAYCHFTSMETVSGMDNMDTSRATTTEGMFSSDENLKSIDISGWDLSKVTDSDEMFMNCKRFTELTLPKTLSVIGSEFAAHCPNMTTITFLQPANMDIEIHGAGENGPFFVKDNADKENPVEYSKTNPLGTKIVTDNQGVLDHDWPSDHRGYKVTVIEKKGGTLTATPVVAINGKKITVKATPDSDCSYTGADAYYIDESGNKRNISLSNSTNTSFTMPAGHVTIEPKWKVPIPILAAQNKWYSQGKTTIPKSKITSIELVDNYDTTGKTIVDQWNAGVLPTYKPNYESGTVTAYVEDDGLLNSNGSDAGTYKLTISGNGSGYIMGNEDSTWAFSEFSALNSITGLEILDTQNVTIMSNMFSYNTKLPYLDVSSLDTHSVTHMEYMFYRCNNLQTLNLNSEQVKLNGRTYDSWDTKNVRSMSSMFSECKSLITLDLSHLDTQKVTLMPYMFENCSALKSVDFGPKSVTLNGRTFDSWDTGVVDGMHYMFSGCSNLTELDVSHFDTNSLTEASRMFYGSGLTNLNIRVKPIMLNGRNTTSWNITNLLTLNEMFSGLGTIPVLNLSGFNPVSVSLMQKVFDFDFKLTNIYVSEHWFTANIDYGERFIFSGCNELKGDNTPLLGAYYTYKSFAPAFCVLNTDGSLVFYGNEDYASIQADLAAGKTVTYNGKTVSKAYTGFEHEVYGKGEAPWFNDRANILSVSFEDYILPDSTSYWFYDCYNIATIDAMKLDTRTAKEMTDMFFNMPRLESITLSEKFSFKGAGTSVLTTLPTPSKEYITGADGNWRMADGTAIDPADVHMDATEAKTYFAGHTPVAFSVLNKDGSMVFYRNADYWNIKASFDAGETVTYKDKKVSGVYSGFEYSHYSKYSQVPWYDVRRMIDSVSFTDRISPVSTAYWFYNCNYMSSFNATNLDTSKVTDMSYMFFKCNLYLQNLDLSTFNTSKLTSMVAMFCHCSALRTLVLSNFDTSNVSNPDSVFYNLSALREITVSEKFNLFNCLPNTSMSGADGKWYTADGVGFAPENLITAHKAVGTSATYYALKPNDTLVAFSVLNTDGSLVFYRNGDYESIQNSLVAGETVTYKDKTVSKIYTGFETETYKGDTVPWSNDRTSIMNVSFFDEIYPVSTAYWFYNASSLTSFDGTNLSTVNVTSMDYMFSGCSNLTSIDLNSFKTGNVTSMASMFEGNTSLTKLDLSQFDTGKVKDMTDMFSNMLKLEEIKLGVTFSFKGAGTSTLTILPTQSGEHIPGADGKWYSDIGTATAPAGTQMEADEVTITYYAVPSPVAFSVLNTDGSMVFYKNTDFWTLQESLAAGEPVTYKDKTVYRIYVGFESRTYKEKQYLPWYADALRITTVSFAEKISPVSTRCWFEPCRGLSEFNSANLDTSRVTDMSKMFYECVSLKTLDLSNFDTRNTTHMSNMFYHMEYLEKITLGENFSFQGARDFALTSLPVPNVKYIPGADQRWYIEDGTGYYPAQLNDVHIAGGTTATYYAVKK